MNKFFKSMWLLPLFIIAIMSCLTLGACSDDDKDEPQNTDENPIVGIWLCDNDTWAFQLKANGTGVVYLQEGNYPLSKDAITWKYNSSSKHLVIYGEDGEWIWDFEILELTDVKFSAIEDGGSYYSFHKRTNLSFLDNWR